MILSGMMGFRRGHVKSSEYSENSGAGRSRWRALRILFGIYLAMTLLFIVSLFSAFADEMPSSTPSPEPSKAPLMLSIQEGDTLKLDLKDTLTELILDSSGSMRQTYQHRTKLLQAKRVLRSFLLQNKAINSQMSLRVYGLKQGDCKDSRLVMKFGEKGTAELGTAIDSINPQHYGKTPLAFSLEEAAKDLMKSNPPKKRIILVTDGVETCGGDPCAVAEKIKKQLDVEIYVVGYTLSEGDKKQLLCLAEKTGGKYYSASDVNSLLNAMKSLSKNENPNLFVKSPDPMGVSTVYKILPNGKRELVEQFVSSLGTRVETDILLEVVVQLSTPYSFKNVIVKPKEIKTLVVAGTGRILVRFGEQLFTLSLLDLQGTTIATFPSDVETRVPVGSYKMRAASPPFAETLVDDVEITPDGYHEEKVKGFGAIEILPGKTRGLDPLGYYVFDDLKKMDIGSFLTGTPLVLPLGRYTVKSDGNSLVKNIYPDPFEKLKIDLPAAGQTLIYKPKRVMLQEEPEGSKHQGEHPGPATKAAPN